MLHKIVTASLVLVGLVIAGLSVASGTVWRASDTVVMTTGTQSGSTLLTTAPGVLGLVDDSVTISASSSPEATVVLAIGREVDVTGWIGEDPALVVTGPQDWETLEVTTNDAAVEPSPEATEEPPAEEAPAETAEETPADAAPAAQPDPQGSDMWLASSVGSGTASLEWDASSSDRVLLVAAIGENAETPELTLSWPREVSTPWMLPGIALGVLLMIAGGIYGYITYRSHREGTQSATNSSAPRRGSGDAPTSSDDTPGGGPAARAVPMHEVGGAGTTGTAVLTTPTDEARAGMTRRELREQAARDEAARLEEVNAAARRTKRAWPWTGAIPTVKKQDAAPPAPTQAPADPARPVWLPDGTASTSGSSWRQAWGVRPESGETEGEPAAPNLHPTDGSAPQNNTTTEGH